MRRVRPLRTACLTPSVQTLKLFNVWGPNDVASGISVASRPRATVMRPMRGMLWRASKVNQRHRDRLRTKRYNPLEPDPAARRCRPKTHWRNALECSCSGRSDREMGEIAANADPLLIGFIGGAGGAGILIAERQMVADEIADRLNPAPAARRRPNNCHAVSQSLSVSQ